MAMGLAGEFHMSEEVGRVEGAIRNHLAKYVAWTLGRDNWLHFLVWNALSIDPNHANRMGH